MMPVRTHPAGSGHGSLRTAWQLRAARTARTRLARRGLEHAAQGRLFGYPCQSVDLRDTDQVIEAFGHADPDYVIHAAAMSGVGDCFGILRRQSDQLDRHKVAR